MLMDAVRGRQGQQDLGFDPEGGGSHEYYWLL